MINSDFKKLITLMFRDNESVCVSPNQYAFHSLPVAKLQELATLPLVSNNSSVLTQEVSAASLKLISLNPIQGFRSDANCTAYRSFLVELDIGAIDMQVDYIRRHNLPYSAMVFSGNKSVHTIITLENDLKDEDQYRHYAKWILNIIGIADQNTKNPSRSTRIPGNERENGNLQKLIDFRGKVHNESLASWLKKYDHLEPSIREEYGDENFNEPNSAKIPNWLLRQLKNGIDFSRGRNNIWFQIGCEFAKAGFSSSDTIRILSNYFQAERTFTEKEWQHAIESAFKYRRLKHQRGA